MLDSNAPVRPLRVLFVTPFSLGSTGGVSTVVRMLCGELRQAGHHVSVLMPGERTEAVPVEIDADITAYAAYLRTPVVSRAPLRGLAAFCLFFPLTVYHLARLLRQQTVDVVAAQYPTSWLVYFAVLRPFSRWKLVVTYHGNDAHDLASWPWIDRAIIGFVLSVTDHVVAVSRSLLAEVRSVFPRVPLREAVVPNGARVLEDAEVSGSVGIELPCEFMFTAGHLISRKGFDILLRAVRLLAERGLDLKVVIAGDGPERDSLMQLAGRLEIESSVMFVGNQSHETILRLLKRSFVFVLPSRAEGLPLVLLEAMGAAVPVIATRVDGVPELIEDGKTGLMVPPEDPSALADALARVFADSELRHTLGAAGRERVLRHYTWTAAAREYVRIFRAC